jgi:hypothetical protein
MSATNDLDLNVEAEGEGVNDSLIMVSHSLTHLLTYSPTHFHS